MFNDFFIDEQGRFQLPTEDLTAFIAFLRENKVECSVNEPNAFSAEGRSYGYGHLHNPYDMESAMDLHGKWRDSQETCRESQPQQR